MSYVDAGGVHTRYAEHGAGGPLVLLHGGFADASEFGANIPDLAARFRVGAPELSSTWPRPRARAGCRRWRIGRPLN